MGWSDPNIPEGKSAFPANYDNLKQAKARMTSKGMVNVSKDEKRNVGQKGEPPTNFSKSTYAGHSKGEDTKTTLNLSSVIPTAEETRKGSSNEDWRGVRRQKNTTSSSQGTASSNWENWHDWKK